MIILMLELMGDGHKCKGQTRLNGSRKRPSLRYDATHAITRCPQKPDRDARGHCNGGRDSLCHRWIYCQLRKPLLFPNCLKTSPKLAEVSYIDSHDNCFRRKGFERSQVEGVHVPLGINFVEK